MDKTQSTCDCGRAEAMDAAYHAQKRVRELEALLAEATHLLFVGGGNPTRDLHDWWYRREHPPGVEKA